ncbi:MAG: transposase [Verrucomicrobia bacterium]|nr:transposase [Verrucomicrobiota bacterium]MBI3868596.1 transposase [Verrucomicrobiota bacterium]
MARRLRIQYPGAWYHVSNRGHRDEAIVRNDIDRRRFLETLGETCRKSGWRVHAFALLTDHFHLIVETPRPNLVDAMKWFLGTYTSRFNHRHGVGGHLFTGRYRSQLLDAATPGVKARAAAYLHLNPLLDGAVRTLGDLATFEWTSYPSYVGDGAESVGWLERAAVLADAGRRDDAEGRIAFRRDTEESMASRPLESWDEFRSGWQIGSEPFRQQLLDRLESVRTPEASGKVWKESAELQAERMIQSRLAELGWDEAEMGRRSKTDPEKLSIARELRRETMMTIRWLADRLQLGARNTLRNALSASPAGDVFKKPRAAKVNRGVGSKKSSLPPRPIAPPPSTPAQSFTVEPGWD